MTEREIKFEDIQVGDKIRTDKTFPSGDRVQYSGTVTDVTAGRVRTKNMTFLKSISDNRWVETFYLVERPTPPEPTKTGTIVKMVNGETYIRVPANLRPDSLGPEFAWLKFARTYVVSAFDWSAVLYGNSVAEVIEP